MLLEYFKRRAKERELEREASFFAAGAVVGAVICGNIHKDDATVDDVISGAVIGLFACAVLQAYCPKTTRLIKHLL